MLKLTDDVLKDQIQAFLDGGGSIEPIPTITGEEAKQRNAAIYKARFLSKDRRRKKDVVFKPGW